MNPSLLVLIPLNEQSLAKIAKVFDVIHAPNAGQRAGAIAEYGGTVRAVLTNGAVGLTATEIDRLAQLEFICALGAGYENVAFEHARTRNIVVVNGAGTNDDCVADHAFALLLATVRDIPQLDVACRNGIWRDALPMQPNFSGKRLGIVGLGNIGRKLARRALGFDIEIGYHNRNPRDDVPYRYFDRPIELARWCDYLVVATPGGASTRHLIDGPVLAALGPQGYLVNVARGSVVDTAALAQALAAGALGGAGLDVYESEPEPPQALLHLKNVVLTPHVGGRSPEAIAGSVQQFLDNAARHFAGDAVLTPV
jgi:D-3-phosphoglycerate dehydrogenase